VPQSIAIAEPQPTSSATPLPSTLGAKVARVLLFLWTVTIACPIRYWPVDGSIDNTWVFALNYAAAHGLRMGRDLIWTTGPLGYLVFPQDFGNNLTQALALQSVLWIALIAILADLFFRANLPTRNLIFFSLFFSLSAPLYWFNFLGLENLMLTGALILLVLYRQRGGLPRYVAALLVIGAVPLIKLTSGMLGAGAIAGFLLERAIRNRKQAWREAVLALIVPAAVAMAGCWLFLPSWGAALLYLRGSLEIVKGYSSAMSLTGDPIEFAGVVDVLLAIAAFLFVRNKDRRAMAWSLAALLAVPLAVSFKHGFVRQDLHVVNFFCFAGVALALSAIVLPLDGKRSQVAFLVLLNFGILSMEYMFARLGLDEAVPEMTGMRGVAMAAGALRLSAARADLRAAGEAKVPADARLEPHLRALVGDEPVASLSIAYAGAAVDHLNLQIYPIVQRYSAYTPALDERNAEWIRDRGPRFLLFDGNAIDTRHFWAETPAMWQEVYRWYDTRSLGSRNLLLERRTSPRFTRMVEVGRGAVSIADGFDLPPAVFWKMGCGDSIEGDLRKLVLRVPEVYMQLVDGDGHRQTFRVLPEVLSAPLPGRNLPATLPDLAALLDPGATAPALTKRIVFSGPGLTSYRAACAVEFLAPVP